MWKLNERSHYFNDSFPLFLYYLLNISVVILLLYRALHQSCPIVFFKEMLENFPLIKPSLIKAYPIVEIKGSIICLYHKRSHIRVVLDDEVFKKVDHPSPVTFLLMDRIDSE